MLLFPFIELTLFSLQKIVSFRNGNFQCSEILEQRICISKSVKHILDDILLLNAFSVRRVVELIFLEEFANHFHVLRLMLEDFRVGENEVFEVESRWSCL